MTGIESAEPVVAGVVVSLLFVTSIVAIVWTVRRRSAQGHKVSNAAVAHGWTPVQLEPEEFLPRLDALCRVADQIEPTAA